MAVAAGQAVRNAGRVAKRDLHALAELLTSASAWREMWQRARRKRGLRPERVHALLLLMLLLAAAAWGVGFVVLRALGHPALQDWNIAWALWGVGFATTIALPLPFEPALLAAQAAGGPIVAVLGAAASKTMAAGIVMLLGSALRRKLEDLKEEHRLVRGFIGATERFTRRWGYVAFGVLLAVPLFPDTLPVYLFAVMGLRPLAFLVTNFVGISVRSGIILALGQAVVPDLSGPF